jgi:hypothetical protein
MTKLKVAFSNFTNVPKKEPHNYNRWNFETYLTENTSLCTMQIIQL